MVKRPGYLGKKRDARNISLPRPELSYYAGGSEAAVALPSHYKDGGLGGTAIAFLCQVSRSLVDGTRATQRRHTPLHPPPSTPRVQVTMGCLKLRNRAPAHHLVEHLTGRDVRADRSSQGRIFSLSLG